MAIIERKVLRETTEQVEICDFCQGDLNGDFGRVAYKEQRMSICSLCIGRLTDYLHPKPVEVVPPEPIESTPEPISYEDAPGAKIPPPIPEILVTPPVEKETGN